MTRKQFDIDDVPTIHNLQQLEHLAAEECSGTFESIDDLVLAALDSIKLLPAAVAKHFDIGSFYTGGAHERMAPAGRIRLWRRLSGELSSSLARVRSDPDLRAGGQIELGSRPQTLGEQLDAACSKLELAVQGRGGDSVTLARELVRLTAGTPAGLQGRQLEKLVAKKQIPDGRRHPQEMLRLLHRVRGVARDSHHRLSRSAALVL